MPMDQQTLESLIKKQLPDSIVYIEDLRGDGDHYAVHVTSAAFKGKSRIAQHRLIQEAVKDHDLHALAIQTSVPQE